MRRALSVCCRTVHLAGFAVLLGGHVWDVEPARLVPALWATIASGAALAVLEALPDGRWLLEVRGLLVLLKLGLLALVPLAWAHRVALLMAVVVVASVGSHMPRRFRHAVLVPGTLSPRRQLRSSSSKSCPGPDAPGDSR